MVCGQRAHVHCDCGGGLTVTAEQMPISLSSSPTTGSATRHVAATGTDAHELDAAQNRYSQARAIYVRIAAEAS
jgi:hypothetical protein